MVFDFKNLIAENSINTNNIITNSSIQECYFVDSLNFITESVKEFNNYKKELYVNILESGENYEIITESFSNFFDKAKEIIKKFLLYIKSMFNRFITLLHKSINNEKHIISQKKELNKFNDSHNFTIEGYEYTFKDNIPCIRTTISYKKDFVKLDFDDILKEKDPNKVVKMIDAQYGRLVQELNNDRYDVFRQEVISGDSPIYVEDFAKELSAVYRNGAYEKDTITIDSYKVSTSLDRFENRKEIETSIKKTKDSIEREYERVKKSIENMISRNKDNDIHKLLNIEINGDYDAYSSPVYVTQEALAKVDLFLKAKVSEIVELSNIHTMAFSYKLDAINECIKQDKQILYTALNRIQKDTKDGE